MPRWGGTYYDQLIRRIDVALDRAGDDGGATREYFVRKFKEHRANYVLHALQRDWAFAEIANLTAHACRFVMEGASDLSPQAQLRAERFVNAARGHLFAAERALGAFHGGAHAARTQGLAVVPTEE